jgi:hypothetical protein
VFGNLWRFNGGLMGISWEYHILWIYNQSWWGYNETWGHNQQKMGI